MRRTLLAALLVAPFSLATAQPLRPQVDAWRKAHEREILDEAFAMLAIPNVASNQDDIAKNVVFLTNAFAQRGVALTPLRAPTGGSPALFGELRAPGATRTVVFYAHYDGQPVAGGSWDVEPFAPQLSRYRNSVAVEPVPLPARGDTVDPNVRIRARSASDDKGPIVAMLAGEAHRRRVAFLRRPGACERGTAAGAGCARRDGCGAHLLRSQSRTAQRPLRQLGPQSRGECGDLHREHPR